MTFLVHMTSVNDPNLDVTLKLYTATNLTVSDVIQLATDHGCYDDGFVDIVDVEQGRITDRYITLTSEPVATDAGDVEVLLARGHKSALEANYVFFGATPDEINPWQTGLDIPHTIYDRLTRDNVTKYEGCTAHGRVLCECEG